MRTKKKILVSALLMVIACLLFFGLEKIIASKANEPETSARLIYASNLDEEGNSTETTEYSFEKGEDYSPYAVYVTSKVASGSAITLKASMFDDESGKNVLCEAEFTNIRIWDNNCGVTVETEMGYVDPRLILAGDDSYLDVGWSHYNRGGCTADKYTGADDANEIAEYFNGFVLFDDNDPDYYYNDESVFMGFNDEEKITNPDDPHNGKTVYYISWDMSVTNLTLEDNVVAFIQNTLGTDEVEYSWGMLHVNGSITLGEGSYIEAGDDFCRFEIQNDDVTITGMSLYDFSEDGNLSPLTSGFAGPYCFTEQEIDGNPTMVWTRFYDKNIGNPEVTTAAKKFIYAYANLDFDGDKDKDGDDLRFALATELLIKFRNMYGMFGLYGNYDGAPDEVWYGVFDDALTFMDRIKIDFANPETITAKDADGNSEDIIRYIATIEWGNSEDGEEIKGDVYVYQLNTPEELLICTDFDEKSGSGSTYFVRQAFADKKVLVGDDNVPLEDVDEDYFASVIITDKIGKVAAGGHAVSLYEKNASENLYTFQTISYHTMKEYRDDKWEDLRFDTFVKIFTPTGKYFATATEGETKRYDFVSNANGKAADDIWEADSSVPVKLFIHDNILTRNEGGVITWLLN